MNFVLKNFGFLDLFLVFGECSTVAVVLGFLGSLWLWMAYLCVHGRLAEGQRAEGVSFFTPGGQVYNVYGNDRSLALIF